MTPQNESNFALFTCKARKFNMSSLGTFFSILNNQIYDSFARVICNRYDFEN